ncbi:hypothetical protein SAVIM338S_01122 [Streptomyces avidinii]
MGRQHQADRDAITIEIVFAFISGGLAAALTFAAVYAPAVAFDLSPTTAHTLTTAGGALAGAVFLARVAHVLWHFARPSEHDGR